MRADQRARCDAFLDKIGTPPIAIGMVNVAPDSFWDGGRFVAVEPTLAHAQRLAILHRSIIDVGARVDASREAP